MRQELCDITKELCHLPKAFPYITKRLCDVTKELCDITKSFREMPKRLCEMPKTPGWITKRFRLMRKGRKTQPFSVCDTLNGWNLHKNEKVMFTRRSLDASFKLALS